MRKVQIKMERNLLGYTPFYYRWLCGLLHFLEVYVSDVVVGAAVAGLCACSGLSTCLLGLCLSIEDVLLGCAEGILDCVDGAVNRLDVAALVGFAELLESGFDG